jgi:hypothetical protein
MPVGGVFELAAIDMFLLLATFEFGRVDMILLSDEMRRNEPLGSGEVKDGIIDGIRRRYDLGNSGGGLFGHGGVARESFVQRVLKTDDGQNVGKITRIEKSVYNASIYDSNI